MTEEQTKTELMFVKKAELLHKANKYSAFSVTFLASFIAWLGLYLAEALKSNDVVYPILALVGIILLPTFTYLYYVEASNLSKQAARIEARLYTHSIRKE